MIYNCVHQNLIELRDELGKVLATVKEEDDGMNGEEMWEAEGLSDVHLGWKEALEFVIKKINTKVKEET